MSYTELHSREPFGPAWTQPIDLVGGLVRGSVTQRREIVDAEANYRGWHECDERVNVDSEAYGTVFQFPKADYVGHLRTHRSPKGYGGPAACCRLVWDIDRNNDLEAALSDARKLVRVLRERYGPHAEDGLGVYYSGAKGFHLTLVAPPGFHTFPHVPAVAKLLCLQVARIAGVAVDPSVYDHQRLFRLPNSRHPRTGLHKLFIELDDLERLDMARIIEASRHPAGYALPSVTRDCEQLAEDWIAAESRILTQPVASPGFDGLVASAVGAVLPSSCPIVPKFVRDFIGFGDVQNPGRAVTLFRCAAALAEQGTPAAVVFGLLEDVALNIGLDAYEVQKQIVDGIHHGTKKGETRCPTM